MRLSPLFRKWVLYRILPFMAILLLLFLFRNPILWGMGNFLAVEEPLHKVSHAFVLSGGPRERAKQAALLYHQKLADTLVCTGEIVPDMLQIAGDSLTEGQLTRKVLIQAGVDSNRILLINAGTSTQEEGLEIIAYCKKKHIPSCIVISSMFHTRRVRRVFNTVNTDKAVEIMVSGAPSLSYDENLWWKDEDGLLFVVNEYLKLFYYWYKY